MARRNVRLYSFLRLEKTDLLIEKCAFDSELWVEKPCFYKKPAVQD
jgi:hypothetical protein